MRGARHKLQRLSSYWFVRMGSSSSETVYSAKSSRRVVA